MRTWGISRIPASAAAIRDGTAHRTKWFLVVVGGTTEEEPKMKHRLTAVLTALSLGAGLTAALAQTVVIEPQQETIIREYVTTQPVEPIDPGIDFDITVGSTVPDTVEVYTIESPDLETRYDYVVVEDRTVVVEPDTRRIIHIIE